MTQAICSDESETPDPFCRPMSPDMAFVQTRIANDAKTTSTETILELASLAGRIYADWTSWWEEERHRASPANVPSQGVADAIRPKPGRIHERIQM